MNLFAKALLGISSYTNYIYSVKSYPTTRLQVDEVEADCSAIKVSNLQASLGRVWLEIDLEFYKIGSTSEHIRQSTISATDSKYWELSINPSVSGMVVGETYEIPCSVVELATGNVVQEFTIYYTRTI